jgi:DNA-binding transcriptional LysR family regulator
LAVEFNPMRISLRQLQIFCVVADAGTTASAAAALSLSQSATSAAISELERLLDLPVFDRVGKRLKLNDNGRALVPQALALLDGAQTIERWALDRESQVGTLRIGASSTIGNYLLPALLAGFRERLPESARRGLNLKITIANSAAIAAQVAGFELDVGPCHEPDLTVQPWCEDELLVVMAPTDPIAPKGPLVKRRRRTTISLQTLKDATWLLRETGSGTRETIDQLLIPYLQRLRAGMEFGTSEAIKRAVACGLGISCLSRCVVEDLLQSGALIAPATELPRLSRRFHILVHERKRPTRGMESLVRYLREF